MYTSVICTVCFIAFAVAFYVYFTNSDSDVKTQAEKDHSSRNRRISMIIMVLAAVGCLSCLLYHGRKAFAKMDRGNTDYFRSEDGVLHQCGSSIGSKKGICRTYRQDGSLAWTRPKNGRVACLNFCNQHPTVCNSCTVDAK